MDNRRYHIQKSPEGECKRTAFAISNVAQGLSTSEQGLFSSFRSLAYTLTLKEVFERKNNLQGAKDE